MKITNKFENFIENFKSAVVADEPRRRVLFSTLNFVLAVTSFVMSIINYFTAEYILLISTFSFSLLCLINILLLHYFKVKEIIVYYIFGIESILLLLFFFVTGIPNGFSALWICLIPSFSLLIFGVKKGSMFSFFAFAMMIFLFWTPLGNKILRYDYTDEFMLRFPFLYLSVFTIALVIEFIRKETQNQLENAKQGYLHLYRHDALTGLYNRYGINEYIREAFEEQGSERASIIFFDIDDFKNINDKYGHEFGDDVLKFVSSIPLRTMCKHCHCCRWGGEEFLIIMQCDHDPVSVAEKIRNEVANTPLMFNDEAVYVTISMGVCIADNLLNVSIHDVVDLADSALYESKKNGKNKVTVKII